MKLSYYAGEGDTVHIETKEGEDLEALAKQFAEEYEFDLPPDWVRQLREDGVTEQGIVFYNRYVPDPDSHTYEPDGTVDALPAGEWITRPGAADRIFVAEDGVEFLAQYHELRVE